MSVRRLGLVVLMACTAFTAWGQDAARLQKFDRQLEQIRREQQILPNADVPTGQRMLVDYGASFTFAFAAIDDREQNTHILRQTELNAQVRVELDGIHQMFLRVRTIYRDFNHGDSFDTHGDDWVEPQLERGHYRINLGRLMSLDSDNPGELDIIVQVGRQLVHWGNGLVLSEEMDGGLFTVGNGTTSAQVLVAQMRNSATDFDSSRPSFSNDTKRNFYGVLLTHELSAYHTVYAYGLVQQDQNDQPPRTNTPGGFTDFDYDSWYIGIGSRGTLSDRLRYGIEFAFEGGEGLSADFPTAQTREDIEAWALDITLDYVRFDPINTRFSFEVLLASGDSDRTNTSDTVGGNTPGTDDNAFNAFGLLHTGFAFTPNASNLLMVKAGVSANPLRNISMFRRMQAGGFVLVFNKLNKNGAVDEPSLPHRYLGTEFDVFVNWRLTSDLSVAVRYGVFFPGDGLASDNDERHFVFVGTTLAF